MKPWESDALCLWPLWPLTSTEAHLVCDGLEVPFILQVMTSADPLLEFLHLFVKTRKAQKKHETKNKQSKCTVIIQPVVELFFLYIILSYFIQ